MRKHFILMLALLFVGMSTVACGDDDDDDNDNGNNEDNNDNNDNNDDDECEEDDDCEDGDICDDGACVAPPECAANEDCEEEGKNICDEDAGACVACIENDDCDGEAGETCVDNNCVIEPECEEDGDCEDGELCVGGQCVEDNGNELCDAYCALTVGTCVDVIGAEALGFSNDEECQAACANFSQEGVLDDRGGDTVQCRIYHAEVAGVVAPEFHCPHASVGGGGVCEDEPPGLCETYCAIMIENCPDTFGARVDDIPACIEACEAAGLEDGALGDGLQEAQPNTLQCRITHASLALDDQTECAAADLESNVCVE